MQEYRLEDIFKYINMSDSLWSIKSLFQGNNDSYPLKYDPPYQRKYLWTNIKATNLIETILQHGEIPPVILMEKQTSKEVIDGRQRCETIDKFTNNTLTLKGQGLDNLWYLLNKKKKNLSTELIDRFEQTKLRVIVIKFNNEKETPSEIEDLITREIFKRYNLGMTPLKKEEVYKAQYLQDEINNYFKKNITGSREMRHQLEDIFDHKKKNLEVLMQHIRQLLVQHQIPINRYAYERDDIINKYYDFLSFKNSGEKNAKRIFKNFQEKIYFLNEIKELLITETVKCNGMIFDSLYWALSICEIEGIKTEKINNLIFKEKLVKHITKNIKKFAVEFSNLSNQIIDRYSIFSSFFNSQLQISFTKYLKSDADFVANNKLQIEEYCKERFSPSLEKDFFSKIQPTSSTILDIISDIKSHKFMIRPPYQRNELLKIQKASCLIESILLNLKLHPIYIYLRKDGIKEVIDGQQRLLSIIGYLGELYLDENNKMVKSQKHRFALNLPSNSIDGIHKKKFANLPDQMQMQIKNFNLSIVEIREEDNRHFKPEELFKRLNHKPYPIKENSFEYWNAYTDKHTVASIKDVFNRNPWFYLRIEDSRFLNEELITSLAYLHYCLKSKTIDIKNIKKFLSVYVINDMVSIRLKNKNNITKLLDTKDEKSSFIGSLIEFENEFICKIKLLITVNSIRNEPDKISNKKFDGLLRTTQIRTATNFFLLWILLKGTSLEHIKENKESVQKLLLKTLLLFKNCKDIEEFDVIVMEAWSKLHPNSPPIK